jgi:D-alanine-D-alanine ligase
MKGRRVAILYDDPDATSPRGPSWEECGPVLPVVRAIDEALRSRGADPVPVQIRKGEFGFIRALREARPELVVNIADSFFGETQQEPTLAGILESLEIPFTGTGSKGLALALDKSVAKGVLQSHGLPTPRGQVLLPGEAPTEAPSPLPAIVKPAAEDGSIGIAAESVVETEKALRDRVEYIWDSYDQGALVEEYIEGREINVAVWGNGALLRPLPPSEIDYAGFPEGLPRICTLNAKWDEKSLEFTGSQPVCPAPVPAEILDHLNRIAVRSFEIFYLRDFGRIDFRVDGEGDPFIIDVNPNPDISPDAGFPRSTRAAGYDYAQTIEEIGRLALARHRG